MGIRAPGVRRPSSLQERLTPLLQKQRRTFVRRCFRDATQVRCDQKS